MSSVETRIGKIRAVSGSKILLALDPEIDIAPVIRSRVHRVTQVGSLLKVKVGARYVIGHVSSAVAVSSHHTNENDGEEGTFAWGIIPGERSLELSVFGEIINGVFERGVSSFPDIDSEVHVVDENDLKSIYSNNSEEVLPLTLGELSGGISLPAIVDLQKFVMRHAAIVGSTGSGKSNAVSVVLKKISELKWNNTKVIIVDIHGEYESFMNDDADVVSLRSTTHPFKLPYWLLPFDELIAFIMGRTIQQEDLGTRKFKEEIVKGKVEWAINNGLNDYTNSITVDSPIPFDIRKIWYDLYVKEFATYDNAQRQEEHISWIDKGDSTRLALPTFNPPATGNSAPFKGTQPTGAASLLEKLRTRCIDRNYDFIMGDDSNDVFRLELKTILESWLGGKGVTILDLNNVPSDVIDITVGSISRLLFDISRWGREKEGFGRKRPIFLVYDEAHLYLSDNKYGFSSGASVRTVTRILREGRKYGVGSLIVSQRPSDINSTIFSQLGTIISLRLNNSSDVNVIKSAVPDNLSNMADIIGSLKTGEAFISGESVPLPLRTQFFEIEGRNQSSDPKLVGTWNKDKNIENLEEVIKIWRVQGASINETEE
ncbi:MAG: hypothetical protein CME70_11905 [Halobacteriovorax sp.]|nr:hypothetical protein [Halobacteriovorax sp.]